MPDPALIEALSHLLYSFGLVITAITGAATLLSTLKNRRITTSAAAEIKQASKANADAIQDTLHNGIGEKILARAIEHLVPVMEKQAETAAAKVEEVAKTTAANLVAKERPGPQGKGNA